MFEGQNKDYSSNCSLVTGKSSLPKRIITCPLEGLTSNPTLERFKQELHDS